MRNDYWIPEQSFGTRLRTVRQVKNLNSQDIAEIVGVAYQSVLHWERGGRPKDLHGVANKLANEIGVDPLWLIMGDDYLDQISSMKEAAFDEDDKLATALKGSYRRDAGILTFNPNWDSTLALC